MKRLLVGALVVGLLLAADSQPASAQLSLGVNLSWHWSDDGWRPSPIADGYVTWRQATDVRRARPVLPVHAAPVRLRVPPGHMPPPGMCRLWIVGTPPGHQPPPDSCARIFRMRPRPGVVVLHSPARWERWWGEGRWERDGRWRWDDDRWERDDGSWDRDDDRWERDRDGRVRRGRPGRGRGPRG